MKKILFGMFAAATMLLTSCQQEDFELAQTGDEANVMVTLTTPQIASRAYSDGTTATHLQYAVYDVTDGSAVILPKYTKTDDYINISKNIPFKLVNGHTYRFVFWAAATNADGVYAINFADDTATLSIDYDAYADFFKSNLEDLDAFYVSEDVKVTGDMEKTFELRRPFAQVNLGTNDYADAAAVGYEPNFSEATVSNVYSKLNMFNGTVSDPTELVYNYNIIPDPAKEKFPVDGYDYMNMVYVLADTQQELVTIEYKWKQDDLTETTRTIGSVPVQRNYRTNIFGSLLTSDVDVNIIIVPDYETPDYEMPLNEKALRDAIATENEVFLGEDIELSKVITISKDVTIHLNGHTLYSPATGTGADDGLFTVRDGATVTIKGEGTLETRGNYASILLWACDNSTIIVEGGNYIAHNDGEMAYVGNDRNGTIGGTIVVKGGTFKSDYQTSNYFNAADGPFLAGTANFVVEGGIFYKWNPAASTSEPAPYNPHSWVAEGYESVEMTINGETAYVVVPQGTKPVVNGVQSSINAGGNVTLAEDFYFETGRITLAKATVIDLNGYSISSIGSANGDAIANGATITIKNGEIKPATTADVNKSSATIYHIPSSAQTLTLENVKVTGVNPVYLNSSNAGANIIINSGEFYSDYQNAPAIYNQKGGLITINGGTFGKAGVTYPYLLNINDDFRKTKSDVRECIVVKGGTFINFDPSNNNAEGANTNFVADGYKVVAENKGGDIYYTVVAE